MKIWSKTDGEVREGKYLVVRRDGTVPHWGHFVIGAEDPCAHAGLIAYAAEARQRGLDHEYCASIEELARDFRECAHISAEAALNEGAKGSDPDAGPHRKDCPAVIEMMRGNGDVAALVSQLATALTRAEAAEAKIDSLDRENAHLRVLAHKGGCPYGHGDPVKGCGLGYPGCACMDDHLAMMAWSPEDEEKAAVRLGKRIAELEGERTELVAANRAWNIRCGSISDEPSTLRQQAEAMAVTLERAHEDMQRVNVFVMSKAQIKAPEGVEWWAERMRDVRHAASAFRASSTGEGDPATANASAAVQAAYDAACADASSAIHPKEMK